MSCRCCRCCRSAALLLNIFIVHLQIYALHPVACLYRSLQQQLLHFVYKGGCALWTALPAGGGEERAITMKGRYGVRRASGAPLDTKPLSANAAAAGVDQTGWQQQGHQVTGEETGWQREDDFTLFTEAGQRQQQQPEDSNGGRKSGDLGSSEYVEVLRGIFDSSSMHQRATQTRLTQLPRESVSWGVAAVIATAATVRKLLSFSPVRVTATVLLCPSAAAVTGRVLPCRYILPFVISHLLLVKNQVLAFVRIELHSL